MTRKQRHQRRIAIINELSRMGRHGWRHYTFRDWQPLEAELRSIEKAA